MLAGKIAIETFTYGFGQAMVSNGGPPQPATILQVDTQGGLVLELVFRPEDLPQLKELVAALDAPSQIQTVPAAALSTLPPPPRMDIPRGRR